MARRYLRHFDQGLNAAVTRLRQALSDPADTPRFIETHARIGYRFIAPVEAVSQSQPVSTPVQDLSRATIAAPASVGSFSLATGCGGSPWVYVQ